jgi:hypothetical protein
MELAAILIGFQIVVAVVLLTAAVAKLAAPGSTREAAERMGLPRRISKVIGVILAPAELLLGLSLLTGFWRSITSLAAVVFFLALTAMVGIAVRRGVRVACRCFGTLSAQPISVWSVYRNITLLTLAATVAVANWTMPKLYERVDTVPVPIDWWVLLVATSTTGLLFLYILDSLPGGSLRPFDLRHARHAVDAVGIDALGKVSRDPDHIQGG